MDSNHLILILLLTVFGCGPRSSTATATVIEEDWSKRASTKGRLGSDVTGESYLSVYSEIYNYTQKRKVRLTATVSMRNVSKTATIQLLRADYYNTAGTKIRTYFDFPIDVMPMETLEIVIPHEDIEGGTGSNFSFEWVTPAGCPEPLFEAVMKTMRGNQAMAFTTQAKRTR